MGTKLERGHSGEFFGIHRPKMEKPVCLHNTNQFVFLNNKIFCFIAVSYQAEY
jgi:hypothetical protein